MKANELRIGNFICYHNENEIHQLSSVGIWVHTDKSIDEIPISECKAIPLTKAWLKKFGIKEQKTSNFGGADMWSGLRAWSVNDREWLFRGHPECLILVGYFNTQVKYVHQLQNLYFAITSKELKIKETEHES